MVSSCVGTVEKKTPLYAYLEGSTPGAPSSRSAGVVRLCVLIIVNVPSGLGFAIVHDRAYRCVPLSVCMLVSDVSNEDDRKAYGHWSHKRPRGSHAEEACGMHLQCLEMIDALRIL